MMFKMAIMKVCTEWCLGLSVNSNTGYAYMDLKRLPIFLSFFFGGILKRLNEGTWMVQSIERPMLDFGSGHDPHILRLSHVSGSALDVEPA